MDADILIRNRFFLAGIIIVLVIVFPMVSAENNTGNENQTTVLSISTESSAEPFIAIDPIGNHTVGDVFFINGTTNLPGTDNLEIEIYNFELFGCLVCNHMKSANCGDLSSNKAARISNISISPDRFGTKRWSINITDTSKEFVSGGYLLNVHSDQVSSAQSTAWSQEVLCSHAEVTEPNPVNDYFTLFPATNTSPLMVTRTILPNPPSIQPTTSQTIAPLSTQSSSLPSALAIVVLAAIAILRPVFRKKRD